MSNLKWFLGFSLIGIQVFAVSYEVQVNMNNQTILVPRQVENPQPRNETFYLQMGPGAQPIAIHIPSGCGSTPIFVDRKRNRTITWNDRYRGGSSSGSSYSYGSQTKASASAGGSKAAASGSVRESGASFESSWFDNRLTGQDVENESDRFIYFPCQKK